MTELKSCPFCGGEAVLKKASLRDVAYVRCNNNQCALFCGTIGKNTEEEAIKAWNTRANPWHTGTPTEDGKYLVQYRTGFMEFLSYRDGKWLAKETTETMWGTRLKTKRDDVTDLVVAWQKIEPYKEST